MDSDRLHRRLEREYRTLAVMIAMYCRDCHDDQRDAAGLCPECAALRDYARRRLHACSYGHEKPSCEKCPTHCYRPDKREQVRRVMRHSGPRMLKTHPVMAIRHFVDRRREPPVSRRT